MMAPDVLETVLTDRLDAYARSGDWRVLEEPATAAIDLHGRPLALLGAGSALAQPFVEAALARLDVRLLVDNPRAGEPWRGHRIGNDADFLALARKTPGVVAVICAAGAAGMAHFQALTTRADVPVLDLFSALRRLDMHPVEGAVAMLDHADPDRLVTALATIAARGWFRDPVSRETLARLALYRLSWDQRWVAGLGDLGSLYFGTDVLALTATEVLVDGGAYTGDTILDFARRSGGRWRAIHAFEPDPGNADRLLAHCVNLPGLTLHRAGLWRESSDLPFNAAGQLGSALDSDGALVVPVQALDDVDAGPVSLIKLDIEGAEAAALEGAAATIRHYRPKLALSAYHRAGDLADLPALVERIQPGYRFFLRHHGAAWFDSVIYAIWEGEGR